MPENSVHVEEDEAPFGSLMLPGASRHEDRDDESGGWPARDGLPAQDESVDD